MASPSLWQNTWSILTELDVSDLRDMLHQPFPVVILSRNPRARQGLVDALYTDPTSGVRLSPGPFLWSEALPLSSEALRAATQTRLIFIVIPSNQPDVQMEKEAVAAIRARNPHVPVVVVHIRPGAAQEPYFPMLAYWPGATEVILDPYEPSPLDTELAPLLKKLLPEQEVLLGYHFPGLRPALAKQLIRQTSMANASYAAATGMAELVPVLLIPGNVADFVVLTKNQMLMAYKIALLMGRDVALQDMIAELAGVLGGGFLWRETARRLVGFLPGWGLIPKVAVAYAGTYLIGEATYTWYAYGTRLSAKQMKRFYARALQEGREIAMKMVPSRAIKHRKFPASSSETSRTAPSGKDSTSLEEK